MAERKKQPILVFSPFSGLPSFNAALFVISRSLIDNGENVIFISCNDSSLLPSTNATNISHSDLTYEKIDSKVTFLLDKSSSKSKLHYAFESFVKSGNQIKEFELEGFKLGKVASYEILINLKKLHLDESLNRDFEAIYKSVQDCITVYLLIDEICKAYDPKAIVFYNDYAIMHSAGLAAKKHGADRVLISHASHKNVDFRKINFFYDDTFSGFKRKIESWLSWRSKPLSREIINDVNGDLVHRLWNQKKRSHVYSKPISEGLAFPDRFSLKEKVIVAFTSSPDEVNAGITLNEGLGTSENQISFTFGKNINNCQIIWINELVEFCEAKDYSLIIRVHPRESLNGRSAHLDLLEKNIKAESENVFIIWPDSEISSYDLANYADVALTAWSTIGLEFSRMGVPVIAMADGISNIINDSFHLYENEPKSYFRSIERLLHEKSSIENFRLAIRYWNFFALGNSVDISDLVFTSGYNGVPEYKTPKNASLISKIINKKEYVLDHNLRELCKKDERKTIGAETEALVLAIYELIKRFCFGYDQDAKIILKFIPAKDNLNLHGLKDNEVVFHGNEIYFLENHKIQTKYSKWISRLAKNIKTIAD